MGRRPKAESTSPPFEAGRPAPPEIPAADGTLGALLRQMPTVAWAIDRDLRFTLSEGGGLAALGSVPGEAVGKTLYEYFGTDDPDYPPIAAHHRALSGYAVTFETTWMGRSFHCDVEPLTGEDGGIVGAAGFAIDMTERMLAEGELRRSESKYRALVERIPAVVYLSEYGPKGAWLYISPQIEQVLGYTPEEWLAHPHPMASFTHPDDIEAARRAEEISYEMGTLYRAEYRMRAKDGRWVWILDEASPVRDEAGNVLFMQGLMYDVTGRKQMEQALRRTNRALRMISECNESLIRAKDEPSLLADVCRKIVEVGGYRLAWVGYAEHDEGKTVRPVAQAGFEEGYLDHLDITWADEDRGRGPTGTAIRTRRAAIARNIPEDPAFAPWRKEAMRRGYGSSAALPLQAAGECFGALSVYAAETNAFDIQEVGLLSELAGDLAFGVLAMRAHAGLRETVDELRRTDRQRRELLSRYVTAQEEERRIIASGIHDDTIQAITAVGIRLGALRARLPEDPAVRRALAELDRSVSDAVARLRHLLFELHPPALDHPGGLRSVLRDDLGRLGEETGISVELEESVSSQISNESRIVCYRIIREALTNVRKHSRASKVEVFVGSRDGGAYVRIRDDGVGFDPAEVEGAVPRRFGLTSMRERAELAGGWCRVEGAPGEGTTVELWIPAMTAAAGSSP